MVFAAKLLRPPIRTLGLARCLRDTGPNGNVGRQTHWTRSVKLYIKKGKTARYELLVVEKHVIYELGFCSSETTRCHTSLDELSTTYSKPTTRRVGLLCVRAQDSSGLALVPCTSCAVDKRGRIEMLTHTHTHKETHSMHPTCMKRRFFPGQKGSLFALARPITAKQGCDPAPIVF